MSKEQKYAVYENTWFVSGVTFISGFMNAYFLKVFGNSVSFHTGNMMRIGVYFGEGNYAQAFSCVLIVLLFISGAMFCEVLQNIFKAVDWRDLSLKICTAYTFFLGYASQLIPVGAICNSGYFFFGFYMGIFTKWLGKNFAVSTCTGNIRSLGANMVKSVFKKSRISDVIMNLLLVCSFPLGSLICTKMVLFMEGYQEKAIWLVTVILIEWSIQYSKSLKVVERH